MYSRRRVWGKWTAQTFEIQPVSSSDVEKRLQHQAQPAWQHWETLPRLALILDEMSSHMTTYDVL